MRTPLVNPAPVRLYQTDQDPGVEQPNTEKLNHQIVAADSTTTPVNATKHGVVYDNLGEVQQKICASVKAWPVLSYTLDNQV